MPVCQYHLQMNGFFVLKHYSFMPRSSLRQVFFASLRGHLASGSAQAQSATQTMAEDTISTFTSDPEKLAQLLQQWNAQHQRLYDNKRAAMKEHRKKCTINCASEVDQQWPAGSLKETYLSELAKVIMSESLVTSKDTLLLHTLPACRPPCCMHAVVHA